MDKKLTNLNQSILVITDTDEKRFVLFKYNINRLLLVMFIYPDWNTIFVSFFLLFFFLFLLELSTFKQQTHCTQKFERLKI